MTTTTWPSSVWTAIAAADTDLRRLTTTLQGLRATCSTAAASLPPTPEFHPAAGWLTADGLLALLEITASAGSTPDTHVDEPPDPKTAADAIERLLHRAANLAAAIAGAERATGDGERARVMAEVVKQLALGRELTFGRSW